MKSNDFKVRLFEVGDPKSCLYSWFCCPVALAQSRTHLDGSSCCFNIFCVPVVPYRWMVRSAYNIGNRGNYRHDCVLPLCCPCCVVNQLYQTTLAYGNPTNDGGQRFNTNEWQSNPNHDQCKVCFKTCFCLPCTVADISHQSIGMPYWMGFWCLGCNVCFLRNMIRYQYRIKNYEDDVTDECIVPTFYMSMLALISLILPCITCSVYWTACVSLVMQVDSESLILSPHLKSHRYLVGYSPPSTIIEQKQQLHRSKQTTISSENSFPNPSNSNSQFQIATLNKSIILQKEKSNPNHQNTGNRTYPYPVNNNNNNNNNNGSDEQIITKNPVLQVHN